MAKKWGVACVSDRTASSYFVALDAYGPLRRQEFARTGGAMRLAGRERLGFYPLPMAEAIRIRTFLRFSEETCGAVDPCIGEGAAFAQITTGAQAHRYGIELDANRADKARSIADEVIHGN